MTCVETFISTEAIEPALRNEYWRDVTRPFCETTLPSLEMPATLEGSMRLRHLGALTFGSTVFNAQVYRRNQAMIVRSGLDHYLIHVLVAGFLRGDFDNRSVVAAPGDICFIDLARPYQCSVDAGERLAMTLPRAGIDMVLGTRNIHGLVLRSANPMTQLLRDYLRGFHAVAGQLSAGEDAAAQEALGTLLSAGFMDAFPAQHEPTSVLGLALRSRVLAYMDSHLANPALGPDMLAQRFRVSRAHLYRAFTDLGGIAHVIKTKRLDAAYAHIVDPRHAGVPVSQAAARFGFGHPGRFRKAFTARFGVMPDEAGERYARVPVASQNMLFSHFSAHSRPA